MAEYLTEESLGVHLKNMYGADFIHDKRFIGRFKPDYKNDSLKLIVEYDGDKHYTSAMVILRDALKDKQEEELGYKVVRWPYFVQMANETAELLLGAKYDVRQIYPHGFIDEKCVCPAEFCSLGIEKFINDMKKLSKNIQKEVMKPLEVKIATARFGRREIVPDGLMERMEKEFT